MNHGRAIFGNVEAGSGEARRQMAHGPQARLMMCVQTVKIGSDEAERRRCHPVVRPTMSCRARSCE